MTLDPSLITLISIPAILALVNLAKSFGVSGKWAALLSVGLGVALVLGQHYVDAELWSLISLGLILGLSAAGLYDATAGRKLYAGDVDLIPAQRFVGTDSTMVSTNPQKE